MKETAPRWVPSLATRAIVLAVGAFLALAASIVILVVLEDRQEEQDRQVTRTFDVVSAIQQVRLLLTDAETGMRGYLLTGDAEFLGPYESAEAELEGALDALDTLVADTELQSERMALVRRAAERRMDLIRDLVADDDADSDRLRQVQSGQALMDGIRLDFSRMEAEERRLLEERAKDAEQTRSLLAAVIPIAGIIGLFGLGLSVAFAIRLAHRVGQVTENAKRLGRGDSLLPLRASSDEIGELGDALIGTAGLLRDRQEELNTAREFLEYIIDAGPVVMFRKRLDNGELTYLSPNSERVLGVSPEDVVGEHHFFTNFLHADHQQAFAANVSAAAEGRVDRWYDEYQTTAEHTAEQWVAIETRVRREEGGPAHLLAYVIDITDRIAASQAARIAEERYSALFNRIPTGMITTSPDGSIVDANPAIARMFGYATPAQLMSEVSGMNALYAKPTDRLGFLEEIEREGSVTDFEVEMNRRDGTVIDVAINAALVRDSAGEPVGLEGTAIDVTDRRRAEAEARKARAEADRANQAKSAFLSRMSHELRTPLNSIIGFAQLLDISDPPLDVRDQESVSHIVKAGRHLLDLIDEVLDIAQVEAGRLNMSLEPIEVGDALAQSVDLIRPLAASRQLTLVTDEADCRQHVLADHQRLKQVFLNLLSNAVKYNRVGGSIVVRCETTDDSFAISVTDSGPGIKPEQHDRLFTPFDRLGAEQSHETGTGLGLVLSRHLVEAMGGTLTVTSVEGEGATFTVTLPRTDPPDSGGEHLAEHVTTPPKAGARPVTVIYIEDNLANLRLIERILALRPHIRLEAAMQGRLGLDLIREHRPELVLLDLNLPDMEGRDVLIEIRADPETRSVPVLVISADASQGQVQRLLDTGATGYLTKPVDVVELLRQVDELLA